MRRFTALYLELDATTRTTVKVDALARYFADAPPADAAWAVAFLSGVRPRRPVASRDLRAWAAEAAGLPRWLVDASYDRVGDLAETLSLVVPAPGGDTDVPLARLVAERVVGLRDHDDAGRRALVERTWRELGPDERFVWHKLVLGSFRVGVSRRLVVRALATVAGVDPAIMAHRLMGTWRPSAAAYAALLAPGDGDDDDLRPYPFLLAHAHDGPLADLGDPAAWHVEWKWDGIRAQLIRRGATVALWSRGEERVDEWFPELAQAARSLPDGTVLDGEIVAWEGDAPLPFGLLQRRLNRRVDQPALFPEVPVAFLAFDVLEDGGADARARPFDARRARLHEIVAGADDARLRVPAAPDAADWSARAALLDAARATGAEGLMLKHRDHPYGAGRPRGTWWKRKVDPHVIDAVLVAAQRGSGRRAGLFTDYTFGVWDDGALVTVAKAYSGLTNEEIRAVDRHVRATTVERRGPVHVVRPELVFEIAFDRVQASSRHRAGVAVRFPRMTRRRTDKAPEDADTLETLRALLAADESSRPG